MRLPPRQYLPHIALIAVEAALVFYIVRHGFLFQGSVQVEKDKSWWTLLGPYAAPVAGVFGGAVALWTYFKSHNQKQEHFERQALDGQFRDILDRFTATDPSTRASAANRA